MSLTIGDRLGPYEVVAALGAGGMGEVYAATDARLGRRVAIKVLPPRLAQDSDAHARFEREARAVAALSHPNILAIYDVGTDRAVSYVVMELLDGDTLRDRVAKSPIPWRKALTIAIQVADGLAAAHAKGIVHRDLKPENIFLTSSGQAKILDFGLARIAPLADAETTISGGVTQPGSVLGTVGYMSPEQIRGNQADVTSDIFAFGCVLYEMLCGRGPFARAEPAETMAAALRDEPEPLADRVGGVPAALDAIVAHCLEKQPGDRFQSARDMGFALRAVVTPSGVGPTASPPASGGASPGRARGTWFLTVGLALGLVAGWLGSRAFGPAQFPPEVVRLSLALSKDAPLAPNYNPSAGSSIAISRDGRLMVYVVVRDGVRRLHIRRVDRFEEKELAGTDGAMAPIFSPDGQWVAFFTETSLRKVPSTGGTPAVITPAPPVARGAVWADDGNIYYSESFSSGILAVAASGGRPKSLTAIDLKAGESNHLLPEVLPGSKALLYTVWKGGDFSAASVWAVSLRNGERKLVVESAAAPRYLAPGFLVFSRAGALFAERFDAETFAVSGEAVPVVDGVWTDRATGTAHYALSQNGTIVYAPGGDTVELRRLVSVDRQGRASPLPAQPNLYGTFRLSHDGKRLAVELFNDLFVYDMAAGTFSRESFRGVNQCPVWAVDDRHLTFSSSEGFADPKLYWTDVDGGRRPEPLTREGRVQFPGSWAPDGSALVYAEIGGAPTETDTGWDIWLLRPGATPSRSALIHTPFNEDQPMFSPDGRALAYVSDETGQRQVYVWPFPGTGGRKQISVDGGTEPVWSRRGDELFYRKGRQFFSVPAAGGDLARIGRPRLMFDGDFVVTGGAPSYDVTIDGQRFLMLARAGETPRALRLDVVVGWTQELARRLR